MMERLHVGTTRKHLLTVPFAVAAALAVCVAPAATAATAASDPGAARAGFSAQARSLGLDSSQARNLQTRVDGYLAKTPGASQSAVNRITLAGGGELLLTLPGRSAPVTWVPRAPARRWPRAARTPMCARTAARTSPATSCACSPATTRSPSAGPGQGRGSTTSGPPCTPGSTTATTTSAGPHPAATARTATPPGAGSTGSAPAEACFGSPGAGRSVCDLNGL